ncbi:hypothetical protein TWF132_001593 [Orbilia oligospora]|nr:hypothetical protein TWF132_001593 [Orbilia oligospora]
MNSSSSKDPGIFSKIGIINIHPSIHPLILKRQPPIKLQSAKPHNRTRPKSRKYRKDKQYKHACTPAAKKEQKSSPNNKKAIHTISTALHTYIHTSHPNPKDLAINQSIN